MFVQIVVAKVSNLRVLYVTFGVYIRYNLNQYAIRM